MSLQAPPAKDYELGLSYWPYKESLRKVRDIVCTQTNQNGRVLDLMCGPGYLLGQISARRRDLLLHGVDLDNGNIDLAREQYPKIKFELEDVLTWESDEQFDCVLCTGAIHHLPYAGQEDLMKKMLAKTKVGGFGVISDPYVDSYSNEAERKISAARLGYKYLLETIKNGAPLEVIQDTIDILRNDVVMDEFKDSLERRAITFERVFGRDNLKTTKVWPDKFPSGYGDYITVYQKPIEKASN